MSARCPGEHYLEIASQRRSTCRNKLCPQLCYEHLSNAKLSRADWVSCTLPKRFDLQLQIAAAGVPNFKDRSKFRPHANKAPTYLLEEIVDALRQELDAGRPLAGQDLRQLGKASNIRDHERAFECDP